MTQTPLTTHPLDALLLQSQKLGHRARTRDLLAALWRLTCETGSVVASAEALGRHCGSSVATVRKAIEDLEKGSIIVVQRCPRGGPSRYSVPDPSMRIGQ